MISILTSKLIQPNQLSELNQLNKLNQPNKELRGFAPIGMLECWNSGIMGSGVMQCWINGPATGGIDDK
jgi:hypothetical protein